MIDPILEQATFMDGSQRMIILDDKALPWDENFRLYLTSKLANPHYSPEIMGKVMSECAEAESVVLRGLDCYSNPLPPAVINYGVTQQGLENQLRTSGAGCGHGPLLGRFYFVAPSPCTLQSTSSLATSAPTSSASSRSSSTA